MRVHEAAKSLNLSSQELITKLKEWGIKVKSHMARLDDETVALLKKKMAPPAPSEAPLAAPPRREKTPREGLERRTVPAEMATKTAIAEPEAIRLEFPISVGTLARQLNLKVSEVIKSLMGMGVFANVNQFLSKDIVFKLGAKLGIALEKASEKEDFQEKADEDDLRLAKPRPPVVTLMGHVDHGKTTLLDAIRKTNVAEREAGKITQHIGAYGVDLPGKGHVTFLDTPGHEAFTAMRARGANVTDIVVLVVAADDGVMPQTVEAIDHARDAEVPIVAAINKCDHPQANPQRVMMQLQKLELVPEEWGGKTICCKVSGKTGEGIDHLLEMLLLEAEILELRANPDALAEGAVIEGRLTKGSGPVATVIVQAGTLRTGDVVIAGPYYGRIRALRDDRGKAIREAKPAYPVEVLGLNGVPQAGETLKGIEDERTARTITEKRIFEIQERSRRGASKRHLTLEDLHEKIETGDVKELKLIIKADVQGSVEALTQSLEGLPTAKVRLRVIHGGVGGPSESDVMLAAAADAIVLGFHVKPDARALELAEEEGVDIRTYNVIYQAVEDVRKAMEGLLEPRFKEVLDGRAQVRQIFRSSKFGAVGGGQVLKGKLARSSKVRLIRREKALFEGKFASLRRFKEDVREVAEGYEFGFALEGFQDLREGDLLEAFRIEKESKPELS